MKSQVYHVNHEPGISDPNDEDRTMIRPYATRQHAVSSPVAPATLAERAEAYIAALKRFDWQFEHADDHRAWRRGRDELVRLRAERAVVDPGSVIWLELAHPDYRHEVRS